MIQVQQLALLSSEGIIAIGAVLVAPLASHGRRRLPKIWLLQVLARPADGSVVPELVSAPLGVVEMHHPVRASHRARSSAGRHLPGERGGGFRKRARQNALSGQAVRHGTVRSPQWRWHKRTTKTPLKRMTAL